MKYLIRLFLTIFLLFPMVGYANQEDNTAFRDFNWGESLEEIQKERKTVRIGHNSTYNFEYYVASFKLKETHYLMGYPIVGDGFVVAFWNDKLFMVGSLFEDREEYYLGVLGSMMKRYGMPEYDEKNDQYYWDDNGVQYILTKKDCPGYFMVGIISFSIFTDTFGVEKADQGW